MAHKLPISLSLMCVKAACQVFDIQLGLVLTCTCYTNADLLCIEDPVWSGVV